ncbi:hypothetical protein GHT06_016096 [Daphnia sinensis]|uniref:Uncharacterized protein n=1 Tax=Daphnia sinensis TaxID=1820382 RepID=A0AAD5PU01_9CRUS|nr:hypothetical protein GHT06_016096 [Daphnia sinensis]
MPLRQIRQKPFYPSVAVALVTLAFMSYKFQSYDSDSTALCPRRGDKIVESASPFKYISSLCNCRKEIETTTDNLHADVFDWCSRESTIRGPNQKVITYTLYGDAKNASIFNRYYSLLRNISLTAERDYPAKEAHDQLCQVYCQFDHVDLCSVPLLIERIGNKTTPVDPASLQGLNPRMFRYLVMLDPNADVFISRDVDSLIWPREVDAVDEWLRSNYTFHVMRDHANHQSLMLAGMWGAKIWQRRDLIEGLMRALIVSGQQQIKFQDQLSLADIVWPIAKYDVMAHDTYGCQNERLVRLSPLKVHPFPSKRNGRYYVGGAGHDLYPDKCPEACRPPDHKDWEYC